jgi:hypothetical protein
MSPDSTVRNLFYDWLKKVLLIVYDQDEYRLNQEMQLVSTSHVPPYGYGETHGYTKIIRLIQFPLSAHFIDSTNSSSPSMEDLVQVTKQVIRWHCRLSHVAAHTALFTVQITDSLIPWSELLSFILSSTNPEPYDFVSLLEKGDIRNGIIHQSELLLQSLRDLQESQVITQSYIDSMERVLAEELAKTRNLQVWPCLSFWDVADNPSQQSIGIGKELIPQCSAPFTKCIVDKDHCEENRDPICAS